MNRQQRRAKERTKDPKYNFKVVTEELGPNPTKEEITMWRLKFGTRRERMELYRRLRKNMKRAGRPVA